MMKKFFAGKSHGDIYQPHMPVVDVTEKIEDIFSDARRAARGETSPPGAGPDERFYVVVTPCGVADGIRLYRACGLDLRGA